MPFVETIKVIRFLTRSEILMSLFGEEITIDLGFLIYRKERRVKNRSRRVGTGESRKS